MVGQTLGHYRILKKLGAGGMGVVYRARDEKLDRDVALKFLPADAGDDAKARERLLQEARTASALNHPHICTIHEVCEAGGQAFIVMERIEGQPLNALVRAGGLPVEAVLRYGAQIADALAHAHEHGIVHRDLKSLNVVVTPAGQVKVLDFGLAKRLSGSELDEATRSQKSLTEAGGIVGTLTYMGPEVLRGEPADARSDIWALGVVLYEMAAGQMPFRGQTGFELSSAILREPPAPLPPGVPSGLRAIIERCLAKEPGQRYQHAGEIRAVLEAIEPAASSAGAPATATQTAAAPPQAVARRAGRGWLWLGGAGGLVGLLVVAFALNIGGLRGRPLGRAPRAPIQSLAVLPLTNFSGDPEQEYFADGMTEELITDLAQIGALRVISRTSVMQYKGTKKTLPEIARELNVDGVIEGSVQRSGDRVRITAQLIEARTDRHIWAESYERDLRDVLALQGEVARAIAGEINLKLSSQEKTSLARSRPVNPEAHELYLRGRFAWNKRNKEGLLKSRDLFQQSIQKDPSNALAYAALAESYELLGSYGVLPEAQANADAKTEAAKALELDNSLGEAHAALGFARWSEGDVAAGASELRRAIELNPSDATARLWYGNLLSMTGRREEGFEEIKRAHQADPLSPIINFGMGVRYYHAHQNDQAIAQFRKSIELDADFFQAHDGLASAYEQAGDFAEAIMEGEKAWTLSGKDAQEAGRRFSALRKAYAETGAKGYWLEKLKLVKVDLTHKLAEPIEIASIYGRLNDKERTIEWLQKQVETDPHTSTYSLGDPALDIARSDPRFQDLVRRMNFPP